VPSPHYKSHAEPAGTRVQFFFAIEADTNSDRDKGSEGAVNSWSYFDPLFRCFCARRSFYHQREEKSRDDEQRMFHEHLKCAFAVCLTDPMR
jgi:hypothetical protein